jgi:hypothetical protein
MATTTNYSWTTPDDTALVKDGAAAIRSLGTAIDTTVFTNAGAAIAKTIVDAKGDIIAATAADTVARLAVGTDGQVLKAKASAATGLEWGSAASSKTFSLLNTTSMTTGTQYSITSLSGNDILVVNVVGASVAGTSAYFSMRFNTDTGANYSYTGIAMNTLASNGISINPDSYTGNTSIDLGYVNAAASVYNWTIIIQGCNSTGPKPFTVIGGGTKTTDNNNYILQGLYLGTSVISSAEVRCSATTSFDAGTIKTYGAA